MKKVEAVLEKIDSITKIFYWLGIIALGALFLLVFADVFARFAFNSPIRGTAEISEYLLLGVAFLPLGFAQLRGQHVRVELLLTRLPPRLKNVTLIITLLVTLIFLAIMTWQLGKTAYSDWIMKTTTGQTALSLPVWWQSAIGLIGVIFFVIAVCIQILRTIINGKKI